MNIEFETTNVECKPVVANWGFYFKKEHGKLNRLNVIRAFTDFLQNDKITEMPLPGICMLGGHIYGHHNYKDATPIFTSYLRLIHKVGQMDDLTDFVLKDQTKVLHKRYCVETKNGHLYYFNIGQQNLFTGAMIRDLINEGCLKLDDDYYLESKLRGANLL